MLDILPGETFCVSLLACLTKVLVTNMLILQSRNVHVVSLTFKDMLLRVAAAKREKAEAKSLAFCYMYCKTCSAPLFLLQVPTSSSQSLKIPDDWNPIASAPYMEMYMRRPSQFDYCVIRRAVGSASPPPTSRDHHYSGFEIHPDHPPIAQTWLQTRISWQDGLLHGDENSVLVRQPR